MLVLSSLSVGSIEFLLLTSMHQSIIYENEFFVLKNNTKLFVNNILIKSLYEERHKVKFIFNECKIGLNTFELIVNEQIKESGEFYAN